MSDYKSGHKSNWRRHAANLVCERLKDKKNATVLYLAGPADLDRRVYCKKGFSGNNMIAVENNPEAIKSLRQKRVPVVPYSLGDVLENWPSSWPIDVLIADYCCGLSEEVGYLAWAMCVRPIWAKHSVIIVNLKRGREQYLDPKVFHMLAQVCPDLAISGTKNRGYHFILMLTMKVMQLSGMTPSVTREMPIDAFKRAFSNLFSVLRGVIRFRLLPSYQNPMPSGKGNYFDSVLLSWHKGLVTDEDPAIFRSDVQHSIRAVRAIRTRRRNGRLRSAPQW